MTPLARRVLTELTKPVKDRRLSSGNRSVWPVVGEAHCFDLSDVQDNAFQAGEDYGEFLRRGNYAVESKYLFLPFPVSWFEFQWLRDDTTLPDALRKKRQAVLAESIDHDNNKTRLTWFHETANGFAAEHMCVINLHAARGGLASAMGLATLLEDVRDQIAENETARAGMWKSLLGSLMIINTRSGFNKQTFQTHAGFQRNMLKNAKMVGKFPLHAWTKITLLPPKEAQIKETEAHATGQKCLHYVRQHLKKTTGTLVAAHARGNPALGIRRSYYHLPT